MKVSLKWLQEYVDVTLPADELAAKLTASGSEVAAMVRIGQHWDKVQVARITDIQPHPNADRLRLATVDTDAGQETVVCGAPNIVVGQKVPYAAVGATLVDGHNGQPLTLEAARIRGVVSNGMICSEMELGLSNDHEGILILPEDTPVGAPLAGVLGDTILDLDVTPNRPDCYSVLGLAREVAVLTEQSLREPDSSYQESGEAASSLASVEIADPDLCLRYTATVIRGITVGPSPAWMQERLQAAGMRPINNVVDVTNYVMMELGQPLHAFDLQQVQDRTVTVRRPRAGERLTTLDGVERNLDSETLLICDASGPVGMGGVIGGQNSEISDDTTEVLLESANFASSSIRRTAASLRIRTEASLRFEKGLHPQSAEVGLRRATKLLVELCGGIVAQGIIDVYPGRSDRVPIHLTQHKLVTVLGTELNEGQVSHLLTRLGCQVAGEWGQGLQVTPPWWRPDLTIPEDLAEEVARIIGYDALPTTALRGAVPHMPPDPLRTLKERVRDTLVEAGMQEVITYSLTSIMNLQKVNTEASATERPPLKVANPMSSEQEYLRTTLRAGLLVTLAANERHSPGPLHLFEVGKVFWGRHEDLPEEREQVAGVLAGVRQQPHWEGQEPPLSFYDAKGLLQSLEHDLGLTLEYSPGSDANLAAGRSAALTLDGQVVGVLGELSPEIAQRFDIVSSPVFLFELDLPALVPAVADKRRYLQLPRFPAVTEDLAVVVNQDVPAAAIEAALLEAPLVVDVRLFDVYAGAQVAQGKKSLAYAVTYQASGRTLTGEETSKAREEAIARLRSAYGAELRG